MITIKANLKTRNIDMYRSEEHYNVTAGNDPKTTLKNLCNEYRKSVLNDTEIGILFYLRLVNKPMSMSQLVKLLEVSRQHLHNSLHHLKELNYVSSLLGPDGKTLLWKLIEE